MPTKQLSLLLDEPISQNDTPTKVKKKRPSKKGMPPGTYRESDARRDPVARKQYLDKRYEEKGDIIREKSRAAYWKRRDIILAQKKAKWEDPEWQAERSVYLADYDQRPETKEKKRAHSRKWTKERRENDPGFRIMASLRARLGNALRAFGNGKKFADTTTLIGCSVPELVAHIEAQFEPWMTWDNYGHRGLKNGGIAWAIDHVIPCASFRLEDEEEQKKCCHFSNLSPLEYRENIRKGKKLDWKPVVSVIQALADAKEDDAAPQEPSNDTEKVA